MEICWKMLPWNDSIESKGWICNTTAQGELQSFQDPAIHTDIAFGLPQTFISQGELKSAKCHCTHANDCNLTLIPWEWDVAIECIQVEMGYYSLNAHLQQLANLFLQNFPSPMTPRRLCPWRTHLSFLIVNGHCLLLCTLLLFINQ